MYVSIQKTTFKGVRVLYVSREGQCDHATTTYAVFATVLKSLKASPVSAADGPPFSGVMRAFSDVKKVSKLDTSVAEPIFGTNGGGISFAKSFSRSIALKKG
eukprot:m.80452 g.80452  ORF g.80452 m.80452 type:complete len:102 (+) comp19382_c0_seq1:138-443(+)